MPFIFLFLLCLISSANALTSACKHCILVVDAGSTGSRAHIYDVNEKKHITEIWSKKIKPGLTALESTSSEVNNYLNILFSGAPTENLPVYFYATAGMRLAPYKKQQQYYALIRQWFSEQARWHLQEAKTITGREEALYDWLAVHYQVNGVSFQEKEMSGVIDIGGGSVQIAFPIKDTTNINPQDIQEVNLDGQTFTLFVHSFLGLGQTEVSHQFLDEPTCFSTNYELTTGQLATGDAYSCENRIAPLMNEVHKVNQIVQPAMLASQASRWFSLGGIAELARSKPFHVENNFTVEALFTQANSKICQEQWSNLNTQYPNEEYLYSYCLLSSYYYALIINGYGMKPQETIHLIPTNLSNDWTIGVVINQKLKS